VHRCEFVDLCVNALQPRLELERQELRIVPRLVQVAAVEPQPGLLRWLPHVAQLALPRARVLGQGPSRQ
jgi:hypothetical protein